MPEGPSEPTDYTINVQRRSTSPPTVSGLFSVRGFWSSEDSWALSAHQEVPAVRSLAT